MDIILLKNLDKVGRKFDIVKVKDGYGRNFLIPQGLALVANKVNRNNLESFKRQESSKLNKKLDIFKAIAAKLKGQKLTITAKTGTSGKIFGSVTNIQIAQALRDQLDIDIDRRDILLPDDHIKMIGDYVATLDLHPDVDAKVEFSVIPDDPELAKRLAEAAAEAALDAAAEASDDNL
ncbi:MAG: 50S ribosomal protein L9 [Saprospiraceae bacterium]|nr:50S ribosomal protein L9 [Saprospiraceae bacterium]MCF8249029.1 50S ribosomal protein L9 [Saprospiraceae bacterium]MCF8282413.1 50S ribosomal protein L9 [Bacteroidales bacterium]MCF8310923.1 50S ribosomal protein L9 [Saprospiraceae bacterium]MCF8439489.1 50S ribosomal protein L9 [Saprospiraceae bacterium]